MIRFPEIAPGIPVTLFILIGFVVANGVMLVKRKPGRFMLGINLILVAWAVVMWWMAGKRSGF